VHESSDAHKQVRVDEAASDGVKKRCTGADRRGSLTAVDRLSDSMPSLAVRPSTTTTDQPLHASNGAAGHQKRSAESGRLYGVGQKSGATQTHDHTSVKS